MNASSIIPQGRALSLTKALEFKGQELSKNEQFEGDVLQDYYRENVSEGSGCFDIKDLRETIKTTPIEASSMKAVEAELKGCETAFRDTVIGCVVADALAAVTGNPALAQALTVALTAK